MTHEPANFVIMYVKKHGEIVRYKFKYFKLAYKKYEVLLTLRKGVKFQILVRGEHYVTLNYQTVTLIRDGLLIIKDEPNHDNRHNFTKG